MRSKLADFKSKELYTVKGSAASEKLKDYLKTNSQKVRHIYGLTQAIDSLQKIEGSDSAWGARSEEKSTAVKELKEFTASFVSNSRQSLQILKYNPLSIILTHKDVGIALTHVHLNPKEQNAMTKRLSLCKENEDTMSHFLIHST